MKTNRPRATALLATMSAIVAACATLTAHSDFDSATDFSAYRTFAMVEPAADDIAAPSQDIVDSPLIERRVADALRRGLSAQGLLEVAAEAADLRVAFSIGSRRAVEITTYPDGPWPRRWRTDHWERVSARIYTEGVLVVDLIDAGTRQLVWRGWVTDAVSSRSDIDAEVRRAVAAILAQFPPSKISHGSTQSIPPPA